MGAVWRTCVYQGTHKHSIGIEHVPISDPKLSGPELKMALRFHKRAPDLLSARSGDRPEIISLKYWVEPSDVPVPIQTLDLDLQALLWDVSSERTCMAIHRIARTGLFWSLGSCTWNAFVSCFVVM